MPAGGSIVQGPENLSLFFGQLPPLPPLFRGTDLKALRPCIRKFSSPTSAMFRGEHGHYREQSKKKRVVFADSKGMSLTAVRVLFEIEERPRMIPLPSLRELGAMTNGTVSTCRQGPQWRLDFQLPAPDVASRLQDVMVLLENCSVSASAIHGTVRVMNVSYEKDVHIRITFNSWRSYLDAPCAFMQQLYSGHDKDIFEFTVAFPKSLDEKDKIEFCFQYLPGGYTTPFWDNNNGKNYILCH
ncbi:protein phosphatase 1 regulatory subunit 3C-B-like [Hypomesus transpacificus]|uniref:protein phosphatase 1 regulatory subunit 3C-B-like n=1 Tax=Hypomesus transpacificus TaxID=137520 RepID=UPI001F072B16|nr:protein phosphatase 1 regulatory subunit 3C-B-like [Hypomesus transpacificus]